VKGAPKGGHERMAATPPTDLEFFELTRKQIEHEDSLVNNRTTWLLSLQAFLFAAYGFSLSAKSNLKPLGGPTSTIDEKYTQQLQTSLEISHQLINSARVLFAWMTFLSSIVLLCGIAAAAASMNKLVKQWRDRVKAKSIGETAYPQIIGRLFLY
jgi:hypothetical protein